MGRGRAVRRKCAAWCCKYRRIRLNNNRSTGAKFSADPQPSADGTRTAITRTKLGKWHSAQEEPRSSWSNRKFMVVCYPCWCWAVETCKGKIVFCWRNDFLQSHIRRKYDAIWNPQFNGRAAVEMMLLPAGFQLQQGFQAGSGLPLTMQYMALSAPCQPVAAHSQWVSGTENPPLVTHSPACCGPGFPSC